MTEERQIRVIVADDHPLMRSGVRSTLEREDDIDVVAEAADGSETIRVCVEHEPHVLVLDLSMPGPSFLQTTETLAERAPDVAVLVLTAYDESIYVRSVVKSGAAGYILKDEVPEALVSAVRTVAQGGTWFSRSAFQKLHQAGVEGDAIADLTAREREVLGLVAKGQSNEQISTSLGLAEQTVRNYVSRIYSKVGVESRAKLVVWAREHLVG